MEPNTEALPRMTQVVRGRAGLGSQIQRTRSCSPMRSWAFLEKETAEHRPALQPRGAKAALEWKVAAGLLVLSRVLCLLDCSKTGQKVRRSFNVTSKPRRLSSGSHRLHLTGERPETQRGQNTRPPPHSLPVGEPGQPCSRPAARPPDAHPGALSVVLPSWTLRRG